MTCKSKQIIGCALSGVFSKILQFLMFLNIQINLLILKTYYGQFTLTTKKSLHIIFKDKASNRGFSAGDVSDTTALHVRIIMRSRSD